MFRSEILHCKCIIMSIYKVHNGQLLFFTLVLNIFLENDNLTRGLYVVQHYVVKPVELLLCELCVIVLSH